MFPFSFKMFLYICWQQCLLKLFLFTHLIWASNISNLFGLSIDHLNSGRARTWAICESCVLNQQPSYSYTEATHKPHFGVCAYSRLCFDGGEWRRGKGRSLGQIFFLNILIIMYIFRKKNPYWSLEKKF
jgi:hypothetical protein